MILASPVALPSHLTAHGLPSLVEIPLLQLLAHGWRILLDLIINDHPPDGQANLTISVPDILEKTKSNTDQADSKVDQINKDVVPRCTPL
jgi:hypothetical protein